MTKKTKILCIGRFVDDKFNLLESLWKYTFEMIPGIQPLSQDKAANGLSSINQCEKFLCCLLSLCENNILVYLVSFDVKYNAG